MLLFKTDQNYFDQRMGVGDQLRLKANNTEVSLFSQKERRCRLGCAMMKIIDGQIQLSFGTINPRPLRIEEAKKILQSFKSQGLQFRGENSMIRIQVKKEWVVAESLSSDYLSPNLPDLRWTASGLAQENIVAFGGQHRLAALNLWKNEIEDSLSELTEAKKAALSKRRPQQLQKLEKNIQLAESQLDALKKWPVILYDEGQISIKLI
jgi:hypothetical protein